MRRDGGAVARASTQTAGRGLPAHGSRSYARHRHWRSVPTGLVYMNADRTEELVLLFSTF